MLYCTFSALASWTCLAMVEVIFSWASVLRACTDTTRDLISPLTVFEAVINSTALLHKCAVCVCVLLEDWLEGGGIKRYNLPVHN